MTSAAALAANTNTFASIGDVVAYHGSIVEQHGDYVIINMEFRTWRDEVNGGEFDDDRFDLALLVDGVVVDGATLSNVRRRSFTILADRAPFRR